MRIAVFNSWKTTIGGVLAAAGAILTRDPGTLGLVGAILLAVGAFLTGSMARDNNKSSEDVYEDTYNRAARARESIG